MLVVEITTISSLSIVGITGFFAREKLKKHYEILRMKTKIYNEIKKIEEKESIDFIEMICDIEPTPK